MARIDAMGGTLKAIELGYFQRVLGHEQFERNRAIEEGRRKLVGVNHLAIEERRARDRHLPARPRGRGNPGRRVRKLRAERDECAVQSLLNAVREAARDGSNLVPPILEAVRADATHGELCDAMRDVFGFHSPDAQTCGV